MDERGYVAQALLDRLQDDGMEFRVLGTTDSPENTALVVPRQEFRGMPRRVARFAQDFDLALVQLARIEQQRWRFVLAWSDEVGRPSFLTVSCVADYYRAARRLLRSEELLTGAPDALFFYALAEAIEDQSIDDERGAWLTSLWHSDARGAIERIGRVWRKRRDIRLLAQGAKHGSWHAVRAELPRLRRSLRRAAWPRPDAALPRAANLVHSQAAAVAFVGGLNSLLRERIERDLAPAFPAGLTTIEQDYSAPLRAIDVAVVFDAPDSYRPRFEEIIAVDSRESLAANAVKVERALIGWLERRVERRNPEAVVGANPLAARMLQFACRHRVPVLVDFLGTLLNCGINCRLRSPILMPHPYGIFIHRNAVIGSRVTVMHQVTIGNKHPSDPGVPVIEDNVCIGAGAKILGAVRIGHGATVGANAVVTRDVPSHCTVVGVNRILGAPAFAEASPVSDKQKAQLS